MKIHLLLMILLVCFAVLLNIKIALGDTCTSYSCCSATYTSANCNTYCTQWFDYGTCSGSSCSGYGSCYCCDQPTTTTTTTVPDCYPPCPPKENYDCGDYIAPYPGCYGPCEAGTYCSSGECINGECVDETTTTTTTRPTTTTTTIPGCTQHSDCCGACSGDNHCARCSSMGNCYCYSCSSSGGCASGRYECSPGCSATTTTTTTTTTSPTTTTTPSGCKDCTDDCSQITYMGTLTSGAFSRFTCSLDATYTRDCFYFRAGASGTMTISEDGPNPCDYDIYASYCKDPTCSGISDDCDESCSFDVTSGNYYSFFVKRWSGSGAATVTVSISSATTTTTTTSTTTTTIPTEWGACPIDCQDATYLLAPSGSHCCPDADVVPPDSCVWAGGAGVQRLGIVGTVEGAGDYTYPAESGSCSDSQGKCQRYSFPVGDYDGQTCVARDCCWNVWCHSCAKSGVWDASQAKCVSCDDGVTEVWVRGDTSNVYAGCGGFPSSCNEEGNPGNSLCESACGADPDCDEVTPGTGGCNSNCQPITTTTTTTTIPPGCTNDDDCNPGKHCCNDNNCHECCEDAHCPKVDGIQELCCSPSSDGGTGCPGGPYDYMCKPQKCDTNTDCLGDPPTYRCCDKDPSLPVSIRGSGNCLDKGVWNAHNVWLCDPGTWTECNEDNVNKTQEWYDYRYKCIQETDEFQWIDVSEKSEEASINFVLILNNFINKVISFTVFRLF